MIRRAVLMALATLVATAVASPALAGSSGEIRIRVSLVNSGADPNAKGRVEFRDSSDEDRFKVEVQKLDPGSYDLLVDGSMVGTLTANSKGRGEMEFRTNPEPGEDASPLTFDPRGEFIELKQGSTTFLSLVLPAAPPNKASFIEVRVPLVSTGAIGGARGTAEYRSDGTRQRFQVEIEHVPSGTYGVRVAGNVVGSINVPASVGEVEFDTELEAGHVPLTFDPRGQLVEVLSNGTTILQVVFPN